MTGQQSNGGAHWEKKTKGGPRFSKTPLKTAANHLIEDCYSDVGNVTVKQAIEVPMGIDHVPFWENHPFIFLCGIIHVINNLLR